MYIYILCYIILNYTYYIVLNISYHIDGWASNFSATSRPLVTPSHKRWDPAPSFSRRSVASSATDSGKPCPARCGSPLRAGAGTVAAAAATPQRIASLDGDLKATGKKKGSKPWTTNCLNNIVLIYIYLLLL